MFIVSVVSNACIIDHYAILATLNVDKPMSESKVIDTESYLI